MNADYTSALTDPGFVAFRKTWQNQRKGNDIPLRADIRLQDFATFAVDIMMYELKAPGDLRCRLMGSRVADRVKLQGKDVNWLEMVSPDVRQAGQTFWNALFKTPCGGLMQFSTAYHDGTNRLARCLLLPVQQTDQSCILMAYSRPSGVYRLDPPRDALMISADCFQSTYIDIGHGLPADLPETSDIRLIGGSILKDLYGTD